MAHGTSDDDQMHDRWQAVALTDPDFLAVVGEWCLKRHRETAAIHAIISQLAAEIEGICGQLEIVHTAIASTLPVNHGGSVVTPEEKAWAWHHGNGTSTPWEELPGNIRDHVIEGFRSGRLVLLEPKRVRGVA